MVILQALLIWSFVAVLMVGAAMLFHRYFPDESPWWGFLVPPLALVLICNFIENIVALPSLAWLTPILLGGVVWLAWEKKAFVPSLYLPTGIFLVAFAFTFFIRCLRPDISHTSDGISDLNMISHYYHGERIPPTDDWLPPLHFEWYYALQHYAASVLGRLFVLHIGVAYNVAHALLSALICVTACGAVHRLSGGRIWPVVVMLVLIESAATGASFYVYLTVNNPGLWLASGLNGGLADPALDHNPLWAALHADGRNYDLRLQSPGYWTWRDEYHANASGHWLTLLGVLALAELFVSRRTIWPWVMAALLPLLAATASAWALPIVCLMMGLGLSLALVLGRSPGPTRLFFWCLGGALLAIWPAFNHVATSPEIPEIHWGVPRDEKSPWIFWLISWWPILALWLVGVGWFLRGSSEQKVVRAPLFISLMVVPLMLLGIEQVDIESRYNMVEKMWGYTWAVGLVGIFPYLVLACSAWRGPVGLICRILVGALFINAVISLIGFSRDALQPSWDAQEWHLTGDRQIRREAAKSRLLDILTQTRGATYLAGKTDFCYTQPPAAVVFSGNRCYVAWYLYESRVNSEAEVNYRTALNNAFYEGRMENPKQFLLSNDITGVLIWTDDKLPTSLIDDYRQKLAPDYEYIDCRKDEDSPVGIFLRRPLPRP